LTEGSGLSQEIKDNAKLQHHFNLGSVALAKKDTAAAKREAEELSKGVENSKNSFLVKQSHELAGMIALAEKDYEKAVTELQQANQLNPRNLYRLSQAYEAKGNDAQAREYMQKVVEFNPLPQLPYAFIRTKVQKATMAKKA
jgi:tetratricopeptide (TPR) repeat protein